MNRCDYEHPAGDPYDRADWFLQGESGEFYVCDRHFQMRADAAKSGWTCTSNVCRHCDRVIHERLNGNWVHAHQLNRCHQPQDVPVYGYEAMPDDGEECVCWACLKFGPVGTDVERLADAAIAADKGES